jgi:hypothetical protein
MTDAEPTDAERGLALAPLLKRAGRTIESEIRGRSMGPTLPSGCRIRIQCDEARSYRTGTVVAFMAGRGLVGHRVVWRGADRLGRPLLLTCGDGTPLCDAPVEAARILGEVTEWHDGTVWRPVGAAPPATARWRLGAALVRLVVRLCLTADARLAARVAALLPRLAGRFAPGGAGAPSPDSGD